MAEYTAGFHYEQSDPDRFQQLCQSLIVSEFPGVACYPVGQPDGGRDALQLTDLRSLHKPRLFQVKFVREPAKISNVHTWLKSTIEEEAPKVKHLLAQGFDISEYILITNVPGTAYLKQGSMDKANALLAEEIPIPTRMWWRNDLDRRCEANAKIAWAYPEILRGVDFLAVLSGMFPEAFDQARYSALRKLIIEQHEEDSKVRFQQVELTNDLLGLFIDVPVVITNKPAGKRLKSALFRAAMQVAERVDAATPTRSSSRNYTYGHDELRLGAAALLLDEAVADLAPHVVLDGGPGQGKSTLGQFVCQVHRMRILSDPQLETIYSYYRPASARLPVKVDLREYATWLSGMNPFADDSKERRPSGTTKSLESFIAALISDKSGGMHFSVSDLNIIAQKSALMLFLDGLDEVADVSVRNRVIEEICGAVRRLKESASSLQVLVTTRPSALAEVVGFPVKVFDSWSLSSLTRSLVMQYAEKWAVAESLKPKEHADLKRVLNSKLDQVHMRELAHNPMQLTILLSVIRTRGASLPDKRTTLYDLYVDLFFAREAGKNEVVKEFREELIDIHRYLAWVLHSEAEKGRALGKIESSRLLKVLREYLASEDRDPELANKLFHGVTQRVVFLVGAVEGQYKFEVQPLREYFAAKFLYEDAPHSSAGNPKPGTIDERFDAIARNTYWQNVTRFYAGCFSKGELPALVERLQILCEEGDLALTNYPRALAATLAADWVFSQHQRSLKSIIRLVLASDGYRSLFGSFNEAFTRSDPLVLPDGCGRAELLDRCFEVLGDNRHSDIRYSVARLAQANSPVPALKERWLSYRPTADVTATQSWIFDGYALGALSLCDFDELLSDSSLDLLRESGLVRALAMAGRYDLIDMDDTLVSDFLEDVVINGAVYTVPTSINHELACALLLSCGPILDASNYLYWAGSDIGKNLQRGFGIRLDRTIVKAKRRDLSGFRTIVTKLSQLPLEELKGSYEIWRQFIALAARITGGNDWLTTRIAITASIWAKADSQDESMPRIDINLSDSSIDILTRVQRAKRNKGSIAWWERQFMSAGTKEERIRVLQIAFAFCGPLTLMRLIAAAEEFIEGLSDKELRSISLSDRVGGWVRRRYRGSVADVTQLNLRPRSFALAIRAIGYGLADYCEPARKLRDYSGSDPMVLEFLLSAELNLFGALEEPASEDDWRYIVELSRRAYKLNGESDGLMYHSLRRTGSAMPIGIARMIAEGRQSYPNALVGIAEARCLRYLAEQTVPLIDLARNAWWPDAQE